MRYVHSFVDRVGRIRFYFRYRGKRWSLPCLPGSKEFSTVYDALYQEHITKQERTIAYAPATLGGLIEKYLASNSKLGFLRRSLNTQRVYRRILDRLKQVAGRGIIADLREDHVRRLRQEFLPSTSQADMAVIVIRILWVFAKEELAMVAAIVVRYGLPDGEVEMIRP